MSENNDHAIPGNYADLDYTGDHHRENGDLIWVYKAVDGFYWNDLHNCEHSDPVGPFSTSAEAYHDAQGF